METKKVTEVRAHTELVEAPEKKKSSTKPARIKPERWTKSVLVLDCETTIDQYQSLTFGTYQYCRSSDGVYSRVEEGIFHADDLDGNSISILSSYCKAHNLKLFALTEFRKKVFWPAVGAEAFIVGFNLPFDASRLASASCWSKRKGGAWSFTMGHWQNPSTGEYKENQFSPRFVIKPKDGKGSFFHLTASQEKQQLPQIRCLDLRTLAWALYSQSHSLESACKACGVQGKLIDYKPSGNVSVEEIEYNRQDVRATVELLNALRIEFDLHPIDLPPDKAYSSASIAKAYLKKMGLTEPLQKFDIPAEVSGIAMQSYYGGRAEIRIRHTPVPVVYTDFLSQYPTGNTLMGLWPFLVADKLRVEDATDEVTTLLSSVTLDRTFDTSFWKSLQFFALVQPEGEILPVRTNYSGDTSNIGVNPLTSDKPIWYAGPDLVATTITRRTPPKVIKAVRIVADGIQTGLKSVSLRKATEVNPATGDFFKEIIEARALAKSDSSRSKDEREALSHSLKIIANAGSYGLFVQLDPERVGKDSKTGREKLQVFSGESNFETTSEVFEKPGPWYCPIFGALITAAGRLLLAMLERSVSDLGGSYLFCDTDSMAIVASETGGLVPCAGGSHRMPDGSEAVKAVSWSDVDAIVQRFGKINPYNPDVITGSILKIEDVNFSKDGNQRQLYGFAIAAKRYALWTTDAVNDFKLVKVSGHGLGYLLAPKKGLDKELKEPIWVVEAWDWILRGVLQLPRSIPPWFEFPAMMRFTITTPEVFKALQTRHKDSAYKNQVKPFNFILSAVIDRLTGGLPIGVDPEHFTLIAPYSSDPENWYKSRWVNVHDGKFFQLARPGNRLSYEVGPKTFGDVVGAYILHPEAKSLAPDGGACGPRTSGLLLRTPVFAADGFAYIGKETDRRWEREEDFSLLAPRLQVYRPNETAHLVADPILRQKTRGVSRRKLAKAAGVSEKTVKSARSGKRVRKSTAQKLVNALTYLPR
jgi:hypothetical protein